MTENTPGDDAANLSPEDAFAALGNESRMEIVKSLGDADEPLSFSELHDRVDIRDSGRFNYHLDKLTGHFVKDIEGGYTLRQPGRRVIEAVLSGAVTDTQRLERTSVGLSCSHCKATSIEVDYQEERLGVYCSECAGLYEMDETEYPTTLESPGYHGTLAVPPAALRDRTPEELVLAAITWNGAEKMMATSGVCPRCSAPVSDSVTVCENHDAHSGLCDRCGTRYAVTVQSWCTNCPYERAGIMGIHLIAKPEMREFLIKHDIDLFSPSSERIMHILLDYDEEILTTEPMKARFTFTIGADRLTLTVDQDLSVVETTLGTVDEPA